MNTACWKVDENDEAIFIDIDIEGSKHLHDDNEVNYWSYLPDLILEKIFAHLTIRERFYASMVCRNWYRGFHLPYVWSTFTLEDSTLTRRKFNYYYGWQHVLDHLRTQMCLTTVGKHFKRIVLGPMINFYNLYEFMNMVSFFAEQNILKFRSNITTLKFHFPCNMAVGEEIEEGGRTFGTGGKLLDSLKILMSNLHGLKRLELIDLMLERQEAQFLLDDVCNFCVLTLKTLILINTTKLEYQLLHVGVFLNLQTLVISPQNLGPDVVQLLGDIPLIHLHILENRYTPLETKRTPVPAKIWKDCKKSNPKLKVHLEMDNLKERDVLWQEKAPVSSIIYNSQQMKIQNASIMTAIDFYKDHLNIYAHKNLPRFYQCKKFHERIDSLLLLMVRQCPFIHTLMIRERISTATVLLLAHTAKNLRILHIRRKAVILRADWPQSPDWEPEFYYWLCKASRSYESVETEVSQILGYRWNFLSDQEYKNTSIGIYSTI